MGKPSINFRGGLQWPSREIEAAQLCPSQCDIVEAQVRRLHLRALQQVATFRNSHVAHGQRKLRWLAFASAMRKPRL